jgi:NAD-dependent SIR2 family protein deacetylase
MEQPSLAYAFILGAGFSRNAGIPIQEDFTEALLGGRGSGHGSSGSIVRFLRSFVSKAFGHLQDAKAKYWPEMEDLFTCVDLSANTGHNLGRDFDAAYLRTVRRALIYRIFTMLREKYGAAQREQSQEWKELDMFFRRIPWGESAFISTNWDTVVEEKLLETRCIENFHYGCGALPSALHPEGLRRQDLGGEHAKIVKLHGSINWLYCDSCRRTFWFPAIQSNKVAGQLLGEKDWNIIESGRVVSIDPYLCTECESKALGTRLATFSFAKALEFPMFQKSWFTAERYLRESRTWVFIGYSLPAADFEFKFLLKRIQLSRVNQPKFIVISKGKYAEKTYHQYQHFFGQGVNREENFFDNGLTRVAVSHILAN